MVNNAKSKYLGKKSEFSSLMAGMGQLSNEEKREVGAKSNEVRTVIKKKKKTPPNKQKSRTRWFHKGILPNI